MVIVMFALYVTVYMISSVEMCMALTFRMGQEQMYICQSKGDIRLSVLTMAMFVLSVTVCKMFTVEMCMTLNLTFRIGQDQM